ncbi:DnaJ -like protein subfamily C member 7 [Halotydeus destructor]|nr:DnaJ -like protein subfamily C member 7 [Halotydeus destructor]
MAASGCEPQEASERKIQEVNIALSKGEHEKAIAILTKIIALCPENVEYLMKRGSTFFNQKMYREAMKDAILSRSLAPENVEANILLADCHRTHGNFVIAQSVLKKVFSQKQISEDVRFRIEPMLLTLENLRLDAVRILNLCIEQKYTEASSLCNELLSFAPEFTVAKRVKCLSLTMMGQLEDAGNLVDSLLEVNPSDYDAVFAKAQLMYYGEYYDEANVLLEQVSEYHQLKFGESLQARKACMLDFITALDSAKAAEVKKEYESAIQLYERALKIDVEHTLGNSEIHMKLSKIHARRHSLFKALDHCEQAILLEPLNEKMITKRIDLLERLTLIDEALLQARKFYSSCNDQSKIVPLEAKLNLSRYQRHYFMLSLLPNATNNEISAAYAKKMKYFSSSNELVLVAKEMVQRKREEVDQAYSVLSDKTQRSRYDREIGISKESSDSSGSDDELLTEAKSVTAKTKMQASMSQSMFSSFSESKYVVLNNEPDVSITENEENVDDKDGNFEREDDNPDSLTDSIEIVSDEENICYMVQQSEASPNENTASQTEISMSEKEAQLKHSDGIQRLAENRFLEAIQNFTDAIAMCPETVQYYLSRSDAYLKVPRYAQALEDAWKALEVDGKNVWSYLQILKCSLLVGNISQAEEIVGCLKTLDEAAYQGWLQRLDWLKDSIKKMEKLFAARNYEQVMRICDKVLDKSPGFLQIQVLKAEASIFLNLFEPAEGIIQDLIDIEDVASDVLYLRGLLAYYKDDLENAQQLLAELLSNKPRHVKGIALGGKIELLKSKRDEGEKAFAASRYDDACAKFTEALALDRNSKLINARLYLSRAEANSMQGHTDDALKDCDQSIASNPKYTQAYVRRAKTHMQLSMYDEAVADWETVRETDVSAFSQQSLEKARKMVEGIKRDPFAVLGISATANKYQIMQARDRLTLVHGPDKHVRDASPIRKLHQRKLKAVQEAFDAMMNCQADATEPSVRPKVGPKPKAKNHLAYGDDCQVYVTGFDVELTERELEETMAQHGKVVAVTIRRAAGNMRHAFVTFAEAENALKVQSESISVNGRKLDIRPKRPAPNDDASSTTSGHSSRGLPRHRFAFDEPAVNRSSHVPHRAYPIDHTLWVGIGSRGNITEEDLTRTLSAFGPIASVSMRDLKNGDVFAFVTFFQASDAKKVLNEKVSCKGVLLRISKKTEATKSSAAGFRRTLGSASNLYNSRNTLDDHDYDYYLD